MSELITPYEVGSHYEKTVSIVDVNGLWAFDCYKEDAEEILKRINGYEQLQATNRQLLEALEGLLKWVEPIAGYNADGDAAENETLTVELAKKAITSAKQREEV